MWIEWIGLAIENHGTMGLQPIDSLSTIQGLWIIMGEKPFFQVCGEDKPLKIEGSEMDYGLILGLSMGYPICNKTVSY